MTMEADLVTLLKTVTPKVHADFAPEAQAVPYIVFQGIGGQPLRYLEGAASSLRNTTVQISAWTESRAATLLLIRAIEDALCTSSAFVAKPIGEPVSQAEEDLRLYGSSQDFDIWANR